MRRTFAIAFVLASAARARADEVYPLTLPPLFYVDDAATVSASITNTKRAIAAQWDAADKWLFTLGGGGVIDDAMLTYTLQAHLAFGRRIDVYQQPLMTTGNLRVAIDARLGAETIFTQPGKDDTYALRIAGDGGIGAWAVTPKGVHMGMHVGMDVPFSDPLGRSPEFVVGAMIGMPYGESDPQEAQRELVAVDKMLTSDPKSWPDGAYARGAGAQTEETIISIGVAYARPTDAMFEQRLVLLVGVLYP